MKSEREEKTARLEQIKSELHATTPQQSISDTQELISLLSNAKGDKLFSLRMKLRAKIRELVSVIWVVVSTKGRSNRRMSCEVNFRSGVVAKMIIFSGKENWVAGDAERLGRVNISIDGLEVFAGFENQSPLLYGGR